MLKIPNLWQAFKKSQALRNSIKKSKRECCNRRCAAVDKDIWRDGHKIVMKKMVRYPPRINLTMEDMENIKTHLFPRHADVHFICATDDSFQHFTEEEIVACRNLKPNKATDPGGIPSEILKDLVLENPKDSLIRITASS